MPVFGWWPDEPKLRGNADVSNAIAVTNLVRRIWNVKEGLKDLLVKNPGGVQDRYAQGQAPAGIEVVSQTNVKKID